MKQKLFIFGALILLIIMLIGLNAASYVQKEKQADSELNPNRSSYNAGATGTRAFYDLLTETGRKVVRWQESADELLNKKSKTAPETFVIIGSLKREFSDGERIKLLQWVSTGGKLVIIDREPLKDLVKTTANWSISLTPEEDSPFTNVDPSDAAQMTKDISAAKPVQPTTFTKRLNAVQPSRFASSINFERYEDGEAPKVITNGTEGGIGSAPPPPPKRIEVKPTEENYDEEEMIDAPEEFSVNSNSNKATEKLPKPPKSFPTPTPPVVKTVPVKADLDTPALSAPVVHLANNQKNIVVDFPYGSGNIVILSDPYIVSNGGINLIDNAQLGINLVASRGGVIAFDEYHQGYGTNNNRLLQYFAGTPVIAIFGQIALLLFLLFLSQSRRFARVVPEPEPNRLSKLEYVGAIAELQRRTKAFDLAIENIYTDFRRRAARLVGADNHKISLEDLAKLVSERSGENEFAIYNLMQKCEDIMHGETTGKREVLRLASQLRELEEKLGLKRNRRTKI